MSLVCPAEGRVCCLSLVGPNRGAASDRARARRQPGPPELPLPQRLGPAGGALGHRPRAGRIAQLPPPRPRPPLLSNDPRAAERLALARYRPAGGLLRGAGLSRACRREPLLPRGCAAPPRGEPPRPPPPAGRP